MVFLARTARCLLSKTRLGSNYGGSRVKATHAHSPVASGQLFAFIYFVLMAFLAFHLLFSVCHANNAPGFDLGIGVFIAFPLYI